MKLKWKIWLVVFNYMGINTMQHPNSECEGIKIINWSNLGLRGLKNRLKIGGSVTVYSCEGDLNTRHGRNMQASRHILRTWEYLLSFQSYTAQSITPLLGFSDLCKTIGNSLQTIRGHTVRTCSELSSAPYKMQTKRSHRTQSTIDSLVNVLKREGNIHPAPSTEAFCAHREEAENLSSWIAKKEATDLFCC